MISKLVPNYDFRDHEMTGKVILDENKQKQISPRPGETLMANLPEVQHYYRYVSEESGDSTTKVPRTSWADMYAKPKITIISKARTKIVNDSSCWDDKVFDSTIYKQNYLTFKATKDANWDGIDIVTKSNGRIIKRQLPSDLSVKCNFIQGIASHGVTSLGDRDLADGTYDIEGTDDTSLNTSFIYSGDIAHKDFQACHCQYCTGCELPQLSDHLDDLITLLMDNKIIGELK